MTTWGLMSDPLHRPLPCVGLRAIGLHQMAAAGVKKRIARLRGDAQAAADGEDLVDAAGGDPMLAYVVVKELSRISPGFAMGWGVSIALAGGAIISKGTAEQL